MSAEVPTDVGVVLMLLREGAPKDSPLAQAIGDQKRHEVGLVRVPSGDARNPMTQTCFW